MQCNRRDHTHLQKVQKRGPGLDDPLAQIRGAAAGALDGLHDPLLLLDCAVVRLLCLGSTCRSRELLHGGQELGSLIVGDGEGERRIVGDLGEGRGGAGEQFGGRVARNGDGVAQGSRLGRVGGGGLGEQEGQEGKLLVGLPELLACAKG